MVEETTHPSIAMGSYEHTGEYETEGSGRIMHHLLAYPVIINFAISVTARSGADYSKEQL